MSIDLEALRQRLMEAMASGASPLAVFQEMGLDCGDPAVMQTFMEQAGIDWRSLSSEGQDDLAGMVNKLVDNMSPENKKQLSELVENFTKGAGAGPSLPASLQELLKNWQKP